MPSFVDLTVISVKLLSNTRSMIKPIKNKKDCEIALERVYHLMQKDIIPNSKESDELEILSILIKEFESKFYKLSNISNS